MNGDQLAALLAEDAVNLVDVRTPTEYEGTAGHHCDPVQGHIPGAVNIELEELLHADRRKELDALLEERRDRPGEADRRLLPLRLALRHRGDCADECRDRGRELPRLVARVVKEGLTERA